MIKTIRYWFLMISRIGNDIPMEYLALNIQNIMIKCLYGVRVRVNSFHESWKIMIIMMGHMMGQVQVRIIF